MDQLFEMLKMKTQKETPTDGVPFMIVGLGNPGREYRRSRHNAGFMVVERFAERQAIGMTRVQNKAIIGTGTLGDHRVILVKPQTYMNLSGTSVGPLMKFYKVANLNLMVIHDDLDIPFGTLRIRPGGGSGGQKGVASIIERLASQEFPRMRVGIGRPPGRMDAKNYVLEDFSSAEDEMLRMVLDRAAQAIEAFITTSLDTAMNGFNGAVVKE